MDRDLTYYYAFVRDREKDSFEVTLEKSYDIFVKKFGIPDVIECSVKDIPAEGFVFKGIKVLPVRIPTGVFYFMNDNVKRKEVSE